MFSNKIIQKVILRCYTSFKGHLEENEHFHISLFSSSILFKSGSRNDDVFRKNKTNDDTTLNLYNYSNGFVCLLALLFLYSNKITQAEPKDNADQ